MRRFYTTNLFLPIETDFVVGTFEILNFFIEILVHVRLKHPITRAGCKTRMTRGEMRPPTPHLLLEYAEQ